jgi:DNA-binding XRE family transcriptional regulator
MDSRHYDPAKLIAAREGDGKSQEEIAKALNVNRQTIYRAEAGKNASFELLASYCAIYAIPVTDVINPFPELATTA